MSSDATFPYCVYTRKNDRVIVNAQIPDAVTEYPDSRFPPPNFESFHEEAFALYRDTASKLGAEIPRSSKVAITLLLDHSGSLRGDTSCLLASTIGAISRCLVTADATHEILGFTTRSWQGGLSRAAWLKSGDPFPGRLCDTLHIVHRPFSDTTELSFDALRNMTLPGLAKENVDGEAIEWAADRLRQQNATRRVIIVLSDGAPVDDATLLANAPDILTRHLESVAADLVRHGGIELYALSIVSEHWLPAYYPQYAAISCTEEIRDVVLPLVAGIVSNPNSAPNAEQLERRWKYEEVLDVQVFDLP